MLNGLQANYSLAGKYETLSGVAGNSGEVEDRCNRRCYGLWRTCWLCKCCFALTQFLLFKILP